MVITGPAEQRREERGLAIRAELDYEDIVHEPFGNRADRPCGDRVHRVDEIRDERRVHRRSQGLMFDG